ncbi:hypothetical protein GGI04_004138 [Coemansia thaxteri]|uniref:Uncharacterized protein n=1 Tax=Coemansia thaxteri TaxID=2663907 RepID=A0A9W8EJS7_9FUNG|nr:hypothetical protein GGI04_004138 [Coemansia thaxteri]KAJ2003903.1 hypothetical protein H4R26_002807 [Coemansia thaxteri]KAJ2468876.1 hypothetical protein GGI02_003566 [Coemansia sp. RSA 2322]KAJ2478639.1 hypothetical protein EV174_004250 [Coemansia sp. RSA 2320]
MSTPVFYSSMAAHGQYVPANLVPAYVTAPQRQPAAAMPVAPAGMACSFPRKAVPKRGRSSDTDAASTSDSMDVCRGDDQQRCVFYRKSVAFTSPKRAKAIVESQV